MNSVRDPAIENIEKVLSSIDELIEGKSKSEQQKILDSERDTLIGIVRQMLSKKVPVVGPFLAYCTTKLMTFFGFDPFEWMHFEEYEHNTQLANRLSSNPDLYNALMNAGEFFERKGSKHLSRKSTTFHSEIKSTNDANNLANMIVSFCKVLPALSGSSDITVDPNDIKILLGETIKLILKSESTQQSVKETKSTPLVRPGCYGWVKYTFSSDTSIESSCCSKTKTVKLDALVIYYFFPSELAFRQALREIESLQQ